MEVGTLASETDYNEEVEVVLVNDQERISSLQGTQDL